MAEISVLQHMMPSSASFSPQEMLSFLSANGTIDLSRVRNEMIKTQIDKLIETTHTSPITQGPDGRWRTSVYEGKKRRLIAKKSLDDLKLEVYCFYTGISKEDVFREHTIESLYPRWKEYKALHTNAKTYIIRIDSVWNNHYLNDEIIRIPISKLDKLTLDTWAHKLIKDNEYTKKQYYNHTIIARQVLDYAVELNLIPFNPFSQFKVDSRVFRKEKKQSSETQVFSRDEQAAMEDIEGDKFLVRRMYRAATKEVIDDTKGTFGERSVVLTDKAMEIIEAVNDRKQELGIDNEYIFSLKDQPASYDALKDLYPSYCSKLDITNRSSHKSRKTFVSSLIDGGVNINTVREMVGHNDERTTLSCYCFDRNTDAERKNMIQNALSS